MGLLRFLGGEKIDEINSDSPSFKTSLSQLRDNVHNLKIDTVERELNKWYQDARMTFSAEPKWILRDPPDGFKLSSEQIYFYEFSDAQLSNLSCLLYTSPSPRDQRGSRMPSSA